MTSCPVSGQVMSMRALHWRSIGRAARTVSCAVLARFYPKSLRVHTLLIVCHLPRTRHTRHDGHIWGLTGSRATARQKRRRTYVSTAEEKAQARPRREKPSRTCTWWRLGGEHMVQSRYSISRLSWLWSPPEASSCLLAPMSIWRTRYFEAVELELHLEPDPDNWYATAAI